MTAVSDDVLTRLRGVTVALVSDVLDGLGCREQTAEPGVVPMTAVERLVGRAFTLTVERVTAVPADLYRTQLEATDLLSRQDVVVAATPLEVRSAYWGELFSTRAMTRGCAGALVDGYVRDLAAIRSYGFPVWARGTHPADSAGRFDTVAYQQPVTWAGVLVHPGDAVVADLDGVVVVPAALAAEVVARAEAKRDAEDLVRDELRGGASVAEVYARHGVM